jgi:hypothetical protein
MDVTISLNLISKRQLPYEFGCIAVSPLFNSNENKLLIGSSDGKIHVYCNDKVLCMQSLTYNSSGRYHPRIQGCIHTNSSPPQRNQTKEHRSYNRLQSHNLISTNPGDSEGAITLFTNSEILGRFNLSSPITALTIFQDHTIIAGTQNGTLAAFRPPHEISWKIRTDDSVSFT